MALAEMTGLLPGDFCLEIVVCSTSSCRMRFESFEQAARDLGVPTIPNTNGAELLFFYMALVWNHSELEFSRFWKLGCIEQMAIGESAS